MLTFNCWISTFLSLKQPLSYVEKYASSTIPNPVKNPVSDQPMGFLHAINTNIPITQYRKKDRERDNRKTGCVLRSLT
jgi:hypothetical protein